MDKNEIDDGGPAFQSITHISPNPHIKGHYDICGKEGMSLRDYFAIHATEEDIADYRIRLDEKNFSHTRQNARYKFADAMIAKKRQNHD